jgi:hypothetical protein
LTPIKQTVFWWISGDAGYPFFVKMRCANQEAIRMTAQDDAKRLYLKKVEELVDSIQYGSVTIIIQDGKVIQVEKTEKLRWKS